MHEIKHDGYRLIVRKSGGFVQLFTRNGTDYTACLPAIAAGFFGRKAKAELSDDLTPEVKAFLSWLVVIMWRRQAAAASSSASSGAA